MEIKICSTFLQSKFKKPKANLNKLHMLLKSVWVHSWSFSIVWFSVVVKTL